MRIVCWKWPQWPDVLQRKVSDGNHAMNIIGLTRYISCVLVLLAIMASAITYHPDVQHVGLILPPVLLGAGLLGFGLTILLGRLPATHWVH